MSHGACGEENKHLSLLLVSLGACEEENKHLSLLAEENKHLCLLTLRGRTGVTRLSLGISSALMSNAVICLSHELHIKAERHGYSEKCTVLNVFSSSMFLIREAPVSFLNSYMFLQDALGVWSWSYGSLYLDSSL